LNDDFAAHVQRMPELFKALFDSASVPVSAAGHPASPGIYMLLNSDGEVEHIGRTRNLKQRLRAHRTANHNSASFAFKKARRELGIAASYQKSGSRAALQADEVFGACFRRHVDAVSNMQVKFVSVTNPIDQYMLELYAVFELNMPVDEFNTH